jgi:hypothetical protein
MKKTILEVYALAVCFITVTCLVVCLAIAGYSLIQIEKPDFTINSYTFDQYQSNDAYWKDCGTRYCEMNEAKTPRPGEAELKQQRSEAFSRVLISERRDGLQTLVKTLIVMLVAACAFYFHWIIAKRARANPQA